MATLSLADVLNLMERAFPSGLAEPWDSVGLICGDPAQSVRHVHFALDPVAATVDEAIASGADLLITHHPLYLKGTSTVAANTPKGALIHRLISSNTALFNAHTNADSAAEGTAVVLAELLELTEIKPVDPAQDDPSLGLGRYGRLPTAITANELGQRLAELLPATARGVAIGGDRSARIETIALCPGAGDRYLDRVRDLGVDAMLTSDLRHHPASEALEHDDAPILFDAAHFATESPWMTRAAQVLSRAASDELTVSVSQLNTDPWTTIYVKKDAP